MAHPWRFLAKGFVPGPAGADALGAAKKAAIELYRSRDKGQARPWIHQLSELVAYLEGKPVFGSRLSRTGSLPFRQSSRRAMLTTPG